MCHNFCAEHNMLFPYIKVKISPYIWRLYGVGGFSGAGVIGGGSGGSEANFHFSCETKRASLLPRYTPV